MEIKFMFLLMRTLVFTFLSVSLPAFSSNYVIEDFEIDEIKVYSQGFAVASLTTEGPNSRGCVGSYDGKGPGYYVYIGDVSSVLFQTFQHAYFNSLTVNLGLTDDCQSWAGMTIPLLYRIDV